MCTKVVSIDLSLMKITLCLQQYTKPHKHAIILRLCNLCGSILYIRRHKITRISQLARSISQFLVCVMVFVCEFFPCLCLIVFASGTRQYQKSFSHCIFICLTIGSYECIVCVCSKQMLYRHY